MPTENPIYELECETPEADMFLEAFARRSEMPDDVRAELEEFAAAIEQENDASLEDLLAGPSGTTRVRRGPIMKSQSIDPAHSGITIGLRFLDGSADQKAAVLKHAQAWRTATNDFFRFAESSSAKAIPVTFTGGTNKFSGGKLFLPRVVRDDTQARRGVGHEIGHALGMSHEHFNPQLRVNWKSDAEIAALINAKTPGANWDAGMVRTNITNRASFFTCPVGAGFDRASIMCYPVDPEWTTDGALNVPLNAEISAGDVACIKDLYGL